MTSIVQPDFILTENALAAAAFDFLKSSSIESYAEVAIRHAQSLLQNLRSPIYGTISESLLKKADEHWNYLLQCSMREPSEFELAILLVVLQTYTDSGALSLFRKIATNETPSVAWLNALVRRLKMAGSIYDTLIIIESQTMKTNTTGGASHVEEILRDADRLVCFTNGGMITCLSPLLYMRSTVPVSKKRAEDIPVSIDLTKTSYINHTNYFNSVLKTSNGLVVNCTIKS